MNRTQAKARAAELGISKEEAREFGNLSKTQTWLDAIAAQEAQTQSPSPQPEDLTPATKDLDCCPVLPLPAITAETPEEQQMVAIASEPLCPDPWTPEPEMIEMAEPASPEPPKTTLIYPILLVLVLAWVACQLLLGVGSLLAVVLRAVAQQVDKAATAHLVGLRMAKVSPPVTPVPTLQPEG